MSKFLVRAVHRQGFEGTYRSGRLWPSGADVAVEVLEQDDCPMAMATGADGVSRMVPDPNRLGRKALAEISKDPRISIKASGVVDATSVATSAMAERDTMARELANARVELNALRAQRADADAALAAQEVLRNELRAAAAKASELQARVDELTALVGPATEGGPPQSEEVAPVGKKSKR